MRREPTVPSTAVAAIVERIAPFDALETEHRGDALAWLASTDDVFRRVPPAIPSKHLVAYVVPTDRTRGSVLLVAHRRSGLWLPAGGHVEPGEHPARTASREAAEELGLRAVFADEARTPSFLTVTETIRAPEDRHVDVSLWYALEAGEAQPVTPEAREIAATRWWTPAEVAAADPGGFDPHLPRYLSKVGLGSDDSVAVT